MYFAKHGGENCGITHIYGFYYGVPNKKDFFEKLEMWLEDNYRWNGEYLFEATLNSEQDRYKKVLVDFGFEKVASFDNANSPNQVDVFLLKYNCDFLETKAEDYNYYTLPGCYRS